MKNLKHLVEEGQLINKENGNLYEFGYIGLVDMSGDLSHKTVTFEELEKDFTIMPKDIISELEALRKENLKLKDKLENSNTPRARALETDERKEYNILSQAEVKEIEELFKNGNKTKQFLLATEYNVCPSTISRVHHLSTLDYIAWLKAKGKYNDIHEETTV